MQREANKIVDLVLGNNIPFYWKLLLPRIIISDDGMKEHTDTINWKWDDNDFVMNSMEQTSNTF